jgi:hypothetical protein
MERKIFFDFASIPGHAEKTGSSVHSATLSWEES